MGLTPLTTPMASSVGLQGTMRASIIFYLFLASVIFVSILLVSVGLLPWRVFGLAPRGAEDIGRVEGVDDDKLEGSSIIRLFHDVSPEANVCNTEACEKKGNSLFLQIDFHQDPCDDFYAYVCNRWMMKHKILDDAAGVSVDDLLVDAYETLLADLIQKGRPGYEAVGAIHKRCEHPPKGDTHLLETLGNIGLYPYPVILKKGVTLDGIVRALMSLGVQPYYSLSLERDFQNPQKSFLIVGEPKLLMVSLHPGSDVEDAYLHDALSGFVVEIVHHNRTIQSNAVKMERLLFSFMDRRPKMGVGIQSQLVDVTQQFPNLARRVRTAVSQVFGTDLAKRPIKTHSFKYMHAIERGLILKEYGNFLDYLSYRTFLELSADNDHDLGHLMALVYSRYAGYTSPGLVTRRRLCVRMMSRYEPALLMHMTMDVAVNKLGGKTTFQSLLTLLETTFNDTVLFQTDFDVEFKKSLMESLSAIDWEPIVPDALISYNEIFKRIISIYETAADSKRVIETFMTLATMFRFRDVAQENVDKWIGWRGGILSSYAHLESPFLKLEIPLPVFDFRRDPDASLERFRLPRIGPRIFYALYHAVYHLAYNYGTGKGPAPFVAKLHTLMDCLGRQYGKLRWKGSERRIGPHSLYSNLLDFLALGPSFEAYLRYADLVKKNERLPRVENVTPRQLFFVEYARNFCEVNNATYLDRLLDEGSVSPAWYRVNGPLRNFKPFAKAFNCKLNSFMNPIHSCEL